MSMRPDALISIVIATYNRPDALEAVVQACFAQSDRQFEIIIADDGSGEPTRACVARLQQRATVPLLHVWQPDQGFRLAMARNQGILASRGEYIVLLDGDCIPQRDFVARHRALAQAGCMVTGSRILLDDAFTQRVLADKRDLHTLGLADKLALRARGHLNKALQLLVKLPDLGRVRTRFSWRRIKGCNMAAWRSDIDTVNGFDQSFEGWGHEDADFVVRLHNAGIKRKDGAFATEVFHLWHRENARDEASSNRALVRQRAAERTVRALRGLA
ncbi:glycosyltransferase family 2 protein [Massilia mucilaginosa]|nr:glycosyltransferase family 2 protein [Massilia mucilaginosa]